MSELFWIIQDCTPSDGRDRIYCLTLLQVLASKVNRDLEVNQSERPFQEKLELSGRGYMTN